MSHRVNNLLHHHYHHQRRIFFLVSSSVNHRGYTTQRIRSLLQQLPSTYKIIKNDKSNLSSSCWKVFGFPSKKSTTMDVYEKIIGFVSYRKCLQTFKFSLTTGTRNMKDHSCVRNLPNLDEQPPSAAATSLASTSQTKISSMINRYAQVRLSESEINMIKSLSCSWICEDMRSFSTIEDKGLRTLLQEFINLGISFSDRLKLDSCCLFSFL